MASNNRQSKQPRKGAQDNSRRTPAWSSGARSSPTFSPTSSSPRPSNSGPTHSSSPLSNGTRSDASNTLGALNGLIGVTVTISTKTSQRFEGVVASTNAEGDTTGVTLRDVKDISNPGAPLKDQYFIAATNIENWQSGPADAKLTNGDTFHTDTEISQKKLGGQVRELQAWQAPSDAPLPAMSPFAKGDEVTFGSSSGNIPWDQFDANEKMFGIEATFDEDLYTTKLDRNAPDYKEKERKAQKMANEILNSSSNNPHIAEERNQAIDDSGINEEDKYGAVVRGANAYVPPGARKAATAATGTSAGTSSKTDVPKVSVNGPDGTSVPQSQSPASSSKAPSPAPAANKPPADPVPAFRDFVTNEKQRLTQKRQALVKSDMDKRMAELVKFSQSFKLNKPIPDDLVSILAKDEEKQKLIREKSTKDATSTNARSIGQVVSPGGIPPRAPQITQAKVVEAARKPSVPSSSSSGNKTTTAAAATPSAAGVTAKASAATSATKAEGAKKPAMFIQAIPPFKGGKSKVGAASSTVASAGLPNGSVSSAAVSPAVKSASPSGAANANANINNRLNVNASSFRPNPRASAFTPGATSPNPSTSGQSIASASASPKPKDPVSASPNAFFGTRLIKKVPPVNIKDDFSPLKTNKVSDPTGVSHMWPYSGKRYMMMFPLPQHPPTQPSSHMVPPVPPPMPPPSYDEDAAAQAAARGYMYYPPYGYPGQPMMPGMPPPGPPGAFIPSPYMQPMPYPPGMPPNAMYAPPNMGQMPPQSYMPPPPPPGSYPPPPNGAGPRPSMPPTPIPAPAHPYYHQSPQLQHAVPYPMMMPPPPNAVPHPNPYEGGPAPVQMGGHA
ncbi:hypothetical protein K435DRAFT_772738 [Dendrothele bispora CBS 962.96]|uniref:LsmAD domain-containing protein n=1 Tax=Dendrothele bispora (strain CBS 962.96) TaxID=1314807 RepID=A0A4S8MVT6_DENBC|nr:hypothetical protein K435DRAFT_772738 [Dendrothele bispora CBS 962.96]